MIRSVFHSAKICVIYHFIPIILFFCALPDNARAYSVNDNLMYPISNYSIDDYSGGTQNWSIEELEDGTVCFANNNGLLVKNGTDWNTYRTDKKQILRVVKKYGDKIYAGGGAGEFGYFKKEMSGFYKFVSLSHKINTSYGEVWRIKTQDKKVYIQTGQAIFIFDAESDKLLKQVQFDQIEYFHLQNNRLFIQTATGGFFSTNLNIEDKNIIIDKAHLNNYIIRGTLLEKDELYVFTLKNGIFKCENNLLHPSQKPIQKIASYANIYSMTQTKDKIILGTILDGVYITDKDLNIIKHINTQWGIRNNTILSLFANKEGNIWAGLDNGISYIDIGSQLLYYKFNKEIGVGYTSSKQGKYNYWGTNQGLYYTNDNVSNYSIQLIAGTQGQVWCLKQIGNKLYCGHHNGLLRVDNGKAITEFDKPGIMNIVQLSDNSDYYLVVAYFQLFLFKYDKAKDSFTEVSKIENLINITRDIKKDKDNWLWFIQDNSVVKFKIDTAKYRIKEYDTYRMDGEKRLFSFKHDILLWGQNSFHTYNSRVNDFKSVPKITIDSSSRKDLIEMIYYLPIEILNTQISNSNVVIGDLYYLKNHLQWSVQFLSRQENCYILNGNEGFLNYDYQKKESDFGIRPQVVISEIKVKSKNDNEYQWINTLKLDYTNNSIRFKFNSNNVPNIVYQYKLHGFDENISAFVSKNTKEYTNLPEGHYKFEVWAKDMNGNVSKSTSFEFQVYPPFYRSTLAKVVYIVFSFLFVLLSIYGIKRHIKRKEERQRDLRLEEIEKLEKQYRIETLSSENKLISIEKEKLEERIVHKQIELTNSTRHIIAKNSLLMEVKESLQTIYKEKNIELRDEKLKKIFHLIDSKIDNEDDWTIFENNFSDLHKNFFQRLKADFPDISPTELKLCAYIKLNKSTKEIASLMNITVRGVETSRYRLRKKMNLNRDENISNLLLRY